MGNKTCPTVLNAARRCRECHGAYARQRSTGKRKSQSSHFWRAEKHRFLLPLLAHYKTVLCTWLLPQNICGKLVPSPWPLPVLPSQCWLARVWRLQKSGKNQANYRKRQNEQERKLLLSCSENYVGQYVYEQTRSLENNMAKGWITAKMWQQRNHSLLFLRTGCICCEQ